MIESEASFCKSISIVSFILKFLQILFGRNYDGTLVSSLRKHGSRCSFLFSSVQGHSIPNEKQVQFNKNRGKSQLGRGYKLRF